MRLIGRKTLISEIDSLLKESTDIIKNLAIIQKLKENDARVT